MRLMQQLGEEEADDASSFGWTNTGNISLSRGQGHALATVTLKGYIEQVKRTEQAQAQARVQGAGTEGKAVVPPVVKVRNRDGHLCRLASLHVV